jgi:hypothetical protein
MGMACMYNSMTPLQAIMATEMSVDEVINLVDENAEKELILKAIKSTLKATKEINANDKVDRNRMGSVARVIGSEERLVHTHADSISGCGNES